MIGIERTDLVFFAGPILAAFHEVIRNDFLADHMTLVVRADEQFFGICPDRHIAQIHGDFFLSHEIVMCTTKGGSITM